jgi:hypothetical protein
MQATMSAKSMHCAINSGRRSMRPFQMRRAASKRASPRPISGPRSVSPSFAMLAAEGGAFFSLVNDDA